MSRVLRKYLFKGFGKNTNKLVKYTSLGAGVAALTATPIISHVDKDSNIVNHANGALRFLRTLKIGVWISLDYYFSTMGLDESSQNYKVMMSRIHQRSANNILHGCLVNGGSYIKLGQGLVSMGHILPREYIETLKCLQDKCLKREEGELDKMFMHDFNKKPEELFKSIDREPIAAASIAQVYKAVTKEGDKVAVKVQYIDLQERFKSDVTTIKSLLRIAGALHPDFDFSWVINDMESTLRQELDFIKEGLNAERCARDLKHLRYIHVPKVYWDYTSSRVLVTEFIEGHKISDVETLKKERFSLADVDRKLFEAFGHQIFHTGFVHGDPHSGNVLVRKIKGEAELVLLDHGLYQEVSEKERIALCHMWKAIVLGDEKQMQKFSNMLGVKDYAIFAGVLTQAPVKSRGFKLNAKLTEQDLKDMTEFAKHRFDSIMTCLKEMPTSLLLVIRNLNTIRAISYHHGNPIDRYTTLARTATKSVFGDYSSFTKKLVNLSANIYFEIVLQCQSLARWITNKTYNILYYLGLAPDIEMIASKIKAASI